MPLTAEDRRVARASEVARDLRAVVGSIKRRLRDQTGMGEYTPSQLSVLLRLEDDGPATASALARAEGMRPQSMAPILATLEDAGFVRGAADPSDGRQTLFSLTAAFRKWARDGRALRQDSLVRALHAHLSAAELDELAHAVQLLRRLNDD